VRLRFGHGRGHNRVMTLPAKPFALTVHGFPELIVTSFSITDDWPRPQTMELVAVVHGGECDPPETIRRLVAEPPVVEDYSLRWKAIDVRITVGTSWSFSYAGKVGRRSSPAAVEVALTCIQQ